MGDATLLWTILAAIILMVLVVLALGIGYLITGKSRLRKKCGWTPKRDKDSCPMCGSKEDCDKDKK